MKYDMVIKLYEEDIFKAVNNDDLKQRRIEYWNMLKDKITTELGEFPKVGDYYLTIYWDRLPSSFRINKITKIYKDGLGYEFVYYSISGGSFLLDKPSHITYLGKGNKNWNNFYPMLKERDIRGFFKASEKDLLFKELERVVPQFDRNRTTGDTF
jgi:hypothetical protein